MRRTSVLRQQNLDAGRIYFARADKIIWGPHGRFSRGESLPGPPKVSATGKVDVDENGKILSPLKRQIGGRRPPIRIMKEGLRMNTAEQSCGAFLDALASKAPVPGGGGASALAGALGAALCTMVGNYTVGKQKYAAVEEDVKALMARAEDLRARLLGLVDTDAAAFEPLSRAYAIPKEDPSRGEVMERCLRDAAAAPMEILRLCCEAIDLHSEMLDKGSVMVLSDVGTGAVLCWGALYGAWLNVKVNTKSMADRPYAEAMNAEADGLVDQYWKRAEQIYESVMGRYT